MPRFKNTPWEVKRGQETTSAASVHEAQLAVLMDIRDELQDLNRVLRCPNFLAVPFKLDRIIENTTKARRRKKSA